MTGGIIEGRVELLERLEKASEGSRELDLAVLNHLSDHGSWRWWSEGTVTYSQYGAGAIGNPICSLAPYSTSLDAVLALVEERLPGWQVALSGPWKHAAHTGLSGQIWCAEIVRCTEETGLGYATVNDLGNSAPTPALALLKALVTTLGASETSTGTNPESIEPPQ